eukprot:3859650-Pyramimonas_sp.AAC.1
MTGWWLIDMLSGSAPVCSINFAKIGVGCLNFLDFLLTRDIVSIKLVPCSVCATRVAVSLNILLRGLGTLTPRCKLIMRQPF